MKIVFMGSSDFSLPTLKSLINSGNEVICVYCKPPHIERRGKGIIKSEIQKLAEENGIAVRTPVRLKTEEEIDFFQNLSAELAVVASYGLIIPKAFLDILNGLFFNVHPSSLPRWRGAAPIERTILAGDISTSVCIMRMDQGLDTGDIILKKSFDIEEHTTAKELHDYCANLGGEMILGAIKLLESGAIQYIKQEKIGVTYAHKISSEERKIDFSKTATEVGRIIRCFSPKPGAYFEHNGEKIKIITAEILEDINVMGEPGAILDDKLTIKCQKGVIRPLLLQREGRKMLYTDAFLRGFKFLNSIIVV